MKKTAAICALTFVVAACDGNPFEEDEENPEGDPDTSEGSVYLDQNDLLVVNNFEYDEDRDILIINNIPFDDDANEYDRVATENFLNGFDAYQTNPGAGSGERQYFAVFRRSDSGNSQVTASTSASYVGFGFGGGGAQRIGDSPDLPATGVYAYNGEYGGVRTVLNDVGNGERVEYVTGDVIMTADFGDFDEIGAVDGYISNRVVYDSTGNPILALGSDISLANGSIDFENGTIVASDAVLLDGGGANVGDGNWSGVFAGANGEEIAGTLFVIGVDDVTVAGGGTEERDIREIGGLIATQ